MSKIAMAQKETNLKYSDIVEYDVNTMQELVKEYIKKLLIEPTENDIISWETTGSTMEQYICTITSYSNKAQHPMTIQIKLDLYAIDNELTIDVFYANKYKTVVISEEHYRNEINELYEVILFADSYYNGYSYYDAPNRSEYFSPYVSPTKTIKRGEGKLLNVDFNMSIQVLGKPVENYTEITSFNKREK